MEQYEALLGDQNSDSIIAKLTYHGISFLFMESDIVSDTTLT